MVDPTTARGALARRAPSASDRSRDPDFEEREEHDGTKVLWPTPRRAAADLLAILKDLPPWERFPEDWSTWTASQAHQRARPAPGFVVVADREAHASDLTRVLKEWETSTGRKVVPGREPRVHRSPIDERRQLVQGLRTGFDVFVPQAITAVLAAGGNAAPLRELERDEELHADTVAAAVRELRATTEEPVESFEPIKKISAAHLLGLKHAASLSNLIDDVRRGRFPAWARDHKDEVMSGLRENSAGLLDRRRIEKLAKLKASLLAAKR